MEESFSPFIKPRYEEGRCFASYPSEIERLLGVAAGGQLSQKVIFIFLDAFGWRFFDKFKERSELLMKFQRDGTVTQYTSQFPSTTACHVTTIHFGIPVAETGIFEWNYYEPLAGGVIAPLMFSWAGEKQRETLLKEGFSAETLLPFETFYARLAKRGIPSFIFQNKNYTPSPYSDRAFVPATTVPYETELDGMRALTQTVLETDGPGYFFLYLDSFDESCHQAGPSSAQAEGVLQGLLDALNTLIVSPLQGKVQNTTLLLGSDHGQVEIDPETTFFIDKEVPESVEWIRESPAGRSLVPAGSARDMFLYLKPGSIDRAERILSERLSGVARVVRVEELVRKGFFGPNISQRLRERLSELVVLPFANQSVWWAGENGKFIKPFRGSHGGLTPQEMEIPLLRLAL